MRKRIQNESGASLIVVLMIMSLFGLIVGGLLTEAGASMKYTVTVSDHEKKVYAADAGVQFGLQQLRQNSTLCPRVGVSGPAMPTIEVNGKTVEVSCTTYSGSSGGSDGYAVVTTSTAADSLILTGASGEFKNIGGHIYVSGGVDWGTGIDLEKGDFIQQDHGSGCTDPPTVFWNDSDGTPPGSLHPDLIMDMPEYGYYCQEVTTETPVPSPLHKAPSTVPAVVDVPQTSSYTDAGSGTTSCRIFKPGQYSQPPDLAERNYFKSGVYYFNWTSDTTWDVDHATVHGGRPSDSEAVEERFPPPASCDRAADTTNGYGVLFVFGDQARMKVEEHGGVELFGRTGEAGASDNLSFVAVPTGDSSNWPTGLGGWTASTVSGVPILDIKEGSQQDLAVHGMIYAPTKDVILTATNSVVAQAMGGLVAYTLELKSSASADAFSVSIPAGLPNPRTLLVTACTDPSANSSCEHSGSERPVSSRAVVVVANDDVRTVTVDSWRTRGAIDPS
jgi:hypothetical protein